MTTPARHVLMTVDAGLGLWSQALDLGAALSRRDMRVTLALLGSGFDDADRSEASTRGLACVDVGHAPDRLARDAAEAKAAGTALARIARRESVDLVHLNHPGLAAAAPFDRPVLAASHYCISTWWDAVRRGGLPEDRRWRAALHERGLAAAELMAAPSASFAEATRRLYGFDDAPTVVPHGRAAPQPGHPSRGGPAAAVLTAGRLWDEGKNLAVIDRAAARLPVTVEAAGPLKGPDGAAAAVHHVKPLGPLGAGALRARLAERPIFASAALYEPFGLSVLDAAQAGCALVLSDIPTFRELWDGCAIFVPPHDDRALAAAIVRLLGDRAYRAERAALSTARAARYTAEACADATLRAYETVLASRPTPAGATRTGARG